MNIQEYISSGIVESYVLGLASPEERTEFEKMCEQHPEILQARTSFELALEKQAMENAVSPPIDIKGKIWDEVTNKGKIISIKDNPPKKINWYKYATAACFVLLLGSVFWIASLITKNYTIDKNYWVARQNIKALLEKIGTLQQNPNVKMASMKGMEASPQSVATVYWDTTSHDVYLLVNNLPAPPTDKQYQLWAIFNDKPVDLGVFDIKKERLLIQAKNAQGAQAFAITLEQKGGSPTPQGDMYVMGKL